MYGILKNFRTAQKTSLCAKGVIDVLSLASSEKEEQETKQKLNGYKENITETYTFRTQTSNNA